MSQHDFCFSDVFASGFDSALIKPLTTQPKSMIWMGKTFYWTHPEMSYHSAVQSTCCPFVCCLGCPRDILTRWVELCQRNALGSGAGLFAWHFAPFGGHACEPYLNCHADNQVRPIFRIHVTCPLPLWIFRYRL